MRAPAAAAPTILAMAARSVRTDEITPVRAVEIVMSLSLLILPRIFILGFAIFSWKILIDAFSSWIVWVAGFFLLPWTTITYMMMWGIYSDRVFGVEWVFVAGAFVLDLITWSTLRDR
jgi:hypothetical protein